MNSNNQMIQKGKISSVEGKADRNGDKTTARVLPSTADSIAEQADTIELLKGCIMELADVVYGDGEEDTTA